MKLKFKIASVFLFLIAFTSISYLSIDVISSRDLNLDTLLKVAVAEGESGGSLSCNCVDCPGDESGCWSHDGSSACSPGSSGYSGSWQCEGAGRIEQHVIDCNGPC